MVKHRSLNVLHKRPVSPVGKSTIFISLSTDVEKRVSRFLWLSERKAARKEACLLLCMKRGRRKRSCSLFFGITDRSLATAVKHRVGAG